MLSRLALLALAGLAWLLPASRLVSGQFFCSNAHLNASSAAFQFKQHNNILHYHVSEDAPANTFLGFICSADGQIPSFIVPGADQLLPERELYAAFSINLTTGELSTSGPLDREHRELYQFFGIVSQPFTEIKVTVTVTDVNDNAPSWIYSPPAAPAASAPANQTAAPEYPTFVIEVPEGQKGVRFPLPVATDLDSLQFGVKEFRIVSSNTKQDTFKLVDADSPARPAAPAGALASSPGSQMVEQQAASLLADENPSLVQQVAQQAAVLIPGPPIREPLPSGGSTSKWHIQLEVNHVLDRENQSSYQLLVEALDGGQPPKLGRLMVEVNVADVNDNDPTFARDQYEFQVREDTAKGALLFRLQASDADLGANAQLTYHIKKHSASSSSQLTKGTLVASPPGNTSDTATTTTTTTTTAPNGAQLDAPAPVGTSGARHPSKQRQLQQSLTPNSSKQSPRQPSEMAAAAAAAVAAAAHEGARLAHQAAGEPHSSGPFELDPVKGEIFLAAPLDFETDQLHELLIEARDAGKSPRSGFTTVRINVLDVADDPPVSSAVSRPLDERLRLQGSAGSLGAAGELGRSELAGGRGAFGGAGGSDQDGGPFAAWLQSSLAGWPAQVNSPLVFVIVFVAALAVALSVCLVKIKSNQPESDYTDTAGLTLTSNNGQTKSSPSHSGSNHDAPGGALAVSGAHHRLSHHSERLAGRGAAGSFSGSPFGTAVSGAGKLRGSSGHHGSYLDSTNVYHNLYPASLHQHSHRAAGADGGALEQPTLAGQHCHTQGSHAHHPRAHPSLAHQHQHSHQHQHPHQHQHQHQSAAQQQLEQLAQLRHLQQLQQQLQAPPLAPSAAPDSPARRPLAPLGALRSPSGGSQTASGCGALGGGPDERSATLGGPAAGGCHAHAALASPPASEACAPGAGWPAELGAEYAHDWFGAYNWDYLADWAPDYHSIMPLIEADARVLCQ